MACSTMQGQATISFQHEPTTTRPFFPQGRLIGPTTLSVCTLINDASDELSLPSSHSSLSDLSLAVTRFCYLLRMLAHG